MRTLNSNTKSHGWIIAIVVIFAITALCLGAMFSCSSMMSSMFGDFDGDSAGNPLEGSVAVINIDGTIQYDGTSCSPEGLKNLLDKAESNPSIKAVVLRIDSGGGVATAGEEMSQYVRNFSKPIVVSSAATNASAAYEISSQADYIFTAKTTAIGSIGVALQVTDLSGLFKMLGVDVENIVSDDSKDSTYGTRPLTPEERAWYQDIVNQIDEQFIKTVAEGRDMSIDDVKLLANGLIYTGMDAVENGLADEIGTLEDAVKYASSLAGCEDLPFIYLQKDSSDLATLLDLLSDYKGAFDALTSDDSRLINILESAKESRVQ